MQGSEEYDPQDWDASARMGQVRLDDVNQDDCPQTVVVPDINQDDCRIHVLQSKWLVPLLIGISVVALVALVGVVGMLMQSSKIKSLEKMIDMSSSGELYYKVEDLEDALTDQLAINASLQQALSALNGSVSTLNGSFSTLNGSFSTLNGSFSTLSSEVSTHGSNITSLAADTEQLQTATNLVSPAWSRDTAVAALVTPVAVNIGNYVRSMHADAPSALQAVQAWYPDVDIVEFVEKDIAARRFSSHYGSGDHESEHTLTYRGYSGVGAWAPTHHTAGQYAQMSFDAPTAVCAIATAGRPTLNHWTTKYRLEYYDHEADEWKSVVAGSTDFVGNSDRNTVVTHSFKPVVTRQLRITVLEWKDDILMRFEAYGWQSAQ